MRTKILKGDHQKTSDAIGLVQSLAPDLGPEKGDVCDLDQNRSQEVDLDQEKGGKMSPDVRHREMRLTLGQETGRDGSLDPDLARRRIRGLQPPVLPLSLSPGQEADLDPEKGGKQSPDASHHEVKLSHEPKTRRGIGPDPVPEKRGRKDLEPLSLFLGRNPGQEVGLGLEKEGKVTPAVNDHETRLRQTQKTERDADPDQTLEKRKRQRKFQKTVAHLSKKKNPQKRKIKLSLSQSKLKKFQITFRQINPTPHPPCHPLRSKKS